MKKIRFPFRLNIGFLIHQSVGYSRDFPFNYDNVHLPPDLDLTHLSGNAHLSRTPQGLLAQVDLNSTRTTPCDRCLEPFSLGVHTGFAELYAFTARTVSESELLLPEDGHIDLGPLIREYTLLELPLQALCKPDCRGLCPTCGENLNETGCGHQAQDLDLRLSILESLFKDT